ncbi:MAG: hypothetical protein PVG61_07635, partial [Dehalococcoidia bacterium]
GDRRAIELTQHIVNGDTTAGILTINGVNSDGLDLRQFNRELVEYLRILMLIKTGSEEAGEITAEDRQELKKLSEKITVNRLLKAVKIFGQLEISLDNYSTLPLELALVESTLPETETEKEKTPVKAQPEPVAKKTTPAAPPAAEKPVINTEKPERPVKKAEKTAETTSTIAEPVPQAKEESPPPAAREEAPETPADGNDNIEEIRVNWSKIINEAPGGMGKTPVAALLRSAKPVTLQNDTIVISFKYSYHKEKMDTIENQRIAEKIVSGFLGRTCRVRCVYEHENNHLVKAALNMGAQVIDMEET